MVNINHELIKPRISDSLRTKRIVRQLFTPLKGLETNIEARYVVKCIQIALSLYFHDFCKLCEV